MPAQKRALTAHNSQDSSAPKRVRASESHSDDSADRATQVRKLLKECSKKQRNYLSRMRKFLISQRSRFPRLRRHVNYHKLLERNKISVRSFIEEQIEEYEKEIADQNKEETILKMMVKDEKEQEKKLEKIAKDVVEYKGYELPGVMAVNTGIPSSPYGSFEEDFNDAFEKIPATTRVDAEMEAVPKLKNGDLGYIVWPEKENWNQYSGHWDSGFKEAAECKKLNEEIQILEEELAEEKTDYEEFDSRRDRIILYDQKRNCPDHNDRIRHIERTNLTEQLEQLIRKSFEKKVSIEKLKMDQKHLEASKKKREDLLKSIQDESNSESLKCSVCFEALTNGEQSVHCPQIFGSCGHTVCASCMQKFKARHSPYHWTCHQCRAPSDRVLTNWTVMQMIKEVAGQPQRVIVDAPAAVPIVPAPWRLEQRRDREPNHEAVGADQDLFQEQLNRFIERQQRFFANIENRQVGRDPVAPAPAAPDLRLPIPPLPILLAPGQVPRPLAPQPAPAPAAVLQNLQADAPEEVPQAPEFLNWDSDEEDNEDGDEDEEDELEAPAAPAPAAPAVLIDDDDDLEVLEVHIQAPPQVRLPVVRPEQFNEEIIVLD